MDDNNIPKRVRAKLLREGASRIEKFGWVQGRFGNERIGFCAIGSVRHIHDNRRAITSAMLDLANYVGCLHLTSSVNVHVAFWNDDPLQTKENVVKKMRACARWLEHGGGAR